MGLFNKWDLTVHLFVCPGTAFSGDTKSCNCCSALIFYSYHIANFYFIFKIIIFTVRWICVIIQRPFFSAVAFGRTTKEQAPPSAPVTKQRTYMRQKTNENMAVSTKLSKNIHIYLIKLGMEMFAIVISTCRAWFRTVVFTELKPFSPRYSFTQTFYYQACAQNGY